MAELRTWGLFFLWYFPSNDGVCISQNYNENNILILYSIYTMFRNLTISLSFLDKRILFTYYRHNAETTFTCYHFLLFFFLRKEKISSYYYLWLLYLNRGRRLIEISGSLIWSKTLMELMFNPCGEFWWRPEGPVSHIHSPHLLIGAPGILSDLLRSVQMLKREWGAECNGKLPHLLNL